MDQQLSFFPPDSSADPQSSLFVGIMPGGPAALSIEHLRDSLKRQHGPLGKPVGTDRLHITLAYIDDFHGDIPSRIIKAACQACGEAAAFPVFPVSLDRVETFSGNPNIRPLVMSGGDNPALMDFRRSLLMELMKSGIRCKESRVFKPHLTLSRGAQEISRQSVEPITWTVGEIVLIRSIIGEGRYEHLGRWSLGK